MSAIPAAITEPDAQAVLARLASIAPGPHWVVTCYLKLEPRDRTRGKYLIKMKNRVRERELALARQPLSHEDREAIAANLRSEEHTSELQSPCNLVCRLLLEKKKTIATDL